jgi:hypothetical protein
MEAHMSEERRPAQHRSSERLLRAIAEAQAFYDQRYRELVGDEAWRDAEDEAASWTTVLRGPNAAR